MKLASDTLSSEQQQELGQILSDIECKTSGEIVPIVATASARYDHANYVIGFIFSLIAFSLSWFTFHARSLDNAGWATQHTLTAGLGTMMLIMIIGFVVGTFLAGYFPGLKLFFITRLEMKEAVERRAIDMFHHFRCIPEQQASVVIYISLYEHMVRVQGDESLATKLSIEQWQAIADDIVAQVKRKQFAHALRQGIEQCGKILSDYFPALSPKTQTIANKIYFLD